MSRSRPGTTPLECAEQKGRWAALAGKTEAACPYPDYRTFHGAVTWSRGFRRAWLRGFHKALATGEVNA